MHYYRFNIADWVLETHHLSLEEESIYFRLINYYLQTEIPIPLDTTQVYRKLGIVSFSHTADAILNEFFMKTKKGFLNSFCEKNLKDYKKTVNKNRENGAKGGRPRKGAASEETQWVSSGFPVGTQTEPTGNPNITLTKNY